MWIYHFSFRELSANETRETVVFFVSFIEFITLDEFSVKFIKLYINTGEHA